MINKKSCFEYSCVCLCFFLFKSLNRNYQYMFESMHVFYRLLIYELPLKWQLSKGEDCGPINRFNSATMLCLSQARTLISNVICRGHFLGLLSSGKMRDDCSFCLYWLNWWQWLCPYLDQGQYQRGKAKPWPVIMSFFCDSSRNHAHIWTKVNTRGSLTKPWPAIMSFFFKSPKIMPGGGGCHVRGLT